MDITDDVYKGQRVYTGLTLTFYDFILFRCVTGPVWRQPTANILALFKQYVSQNHLDVGVGSGFLLDHTLKKVKPNTQLLSLMDLNPECLAFTEKRLARFKPESFQRNVLAPIDTSGKRFLSISANYLLHCLPGPFSEKGMSLVYLYDILEPGGVLFGTTLLHDKVQQLGGFARLLNKVYNNKQVFSNQDDTAANIEAFLSSNFDDFSLNFLGGAAIFVIYKPMVM